MTRIRLATIASIGAVALVAAGCGGGSKASSSSSSAPAGSASTAGSGAMLVAKSTPLGKILTAGSGRTLYLFEKDKGMKSSCSGACAANWPPFTTSSSPRVTGGASSSDIKLVRRSDGKMQVTYNGHPLYFFSGDNSAGQTNGQGLNFFGARWYVVSPAGAKIAGKASSSGASPSSSSGGNSSGGYGGY